MIAYYRIGNGKKSQDDDLKNVSDQKYFKKSWKCFLTIQNPPMSSLKRTHTGKKNGGVGQEPGLVVMGGDSCSKGREFESQHQLLDIHFSHLFVVKIQNCNFFGKDRK